MQEVRGTMLNARWLVTLMAAAAVGTGCGIELTPTGLACQDPPNEAEILGEADVPSLIGLEPDAAAARLDEAGIAPSWRYSYYTNPPGRTESYGECWCIPPPDGVVTDVFAEPSEQLIVFVQRSQPMPGGRPQPTEGWGCDAAPEASP